MSGIVPLAGDPHSERRIPRVGSSCITQETGRTLMKVAKRIAIALGSLLAVMLAGGAHFKI